MCAGLTRDPPPPFFGSVHSKGVAKADSGSAHSKGHAGQSTYGQNCHQPSIGARKKLRRGAMESDATFYRGSVKKNRSKVNKKARGLGSPRSELYTARYSLKDDLPNELDVAGFARSNGRSAVEVANGVGHLAETAILRTGRRCAPVGREILEAYITIWGSASKCGHGSHSGG